MSLCNFIFTQFRVLSSQFENNIAQWVNNGITMISSEGLISDIYVQYTNETFLNNLEMEVDSGFLNLNYRSKLNLSFSEFHNTRGMIGGAIYATGSSEINIEN